MSVRPILGSSPGSDWRSAWPAARAAGWSRTELIWEQFQDRANHALSSGDRVGAMRGFRWAWWLASLAFSRTDARYATSLANMAAADRMMGREERARRRYEKALQLWTKVPAQAEVVEVAPRARSSLFHLRMEARHRQTYEATRRLRLAAFTREAAETLAALAAGKQPPHRHHTRWVGERPPVFDDSRRLLAACLLIAVPES